MFGSPETDKVSDFTALSVDALEEISGGGLPLFTETSPGRLPETKYMYWGTIQLNPAPWTWFKERDHSAWQPMDFRP